MLTRIEKDIKGLYKNLETTELSNTNLLITPLSFLGILLGQLLQQGND